MISEYQKEKDILLTNLNKDCQRYFLKKGYILEYAYSCLLNDDIESAKKNFELIKDEDIRAHWGLILISLIEGNVKEYPSYFELRNFLEIDIDILIHYFKGYYVENIVRYSDFMFTINPETHKFIGRVLYNNGFLEQALFFLDRAKSYFYNDPELHYLIAFIYFNIKDYVKAQKAIDDCLQILPDYYPAKYMQEKLRTEQI